MTHEEAIQWLDKAKGNAEALRMAKEALEKRMPRKYLRTSDEAWTCPCCFYQTWDIFQFNFCPKCGQAIDWSEEK